jgi:glycosyltransferase involved in cell wall biosynthesis
MRIVQITRSLATTGGSFYVAHSLAREFRRRGVDVLNVAWFPRELPPRPDLGARHGATVLPRLTAAIRSTHLRMALEAPLFALWSTLTARRQRRPGDLLLSHGDTLAGDVHVAHSCHRAAITAKRADGQWRWVFFPFHWFVLLREAWVFRRGHAPWLIAISRGVADEFRRHYSVPAGRILFIPNGVDRDRYHPVADRAALRRELTLPVDTPLLLFVGHEFTRKGLRLILEGLARCQVDPQPVLAVVGGDDPAPYRAQARALGIAQRVHFFGRRADVWRFCAAADLFVFLSNYEACPLVGLEALASGLPLLTTRVSGMEDFVEPGVNGLFVQRDAGDFARTLARVLQDRELLAKLRAGARPSTESYAWPQIAQRYLEAFERIQGRSAGPSADHRMSIASP